MRSNPSTQYPFPARPPIPPEHGAWAMLFISLIVAHWVARGASLDSILASVGLMFLYLARYPATLIAMRFKWLSHQDAGFFRERLIWTGFYAAIGFALLWKSFIAIPLHHLLGFGSMGMVLMAFEWIAVANQAQKTAFSEIIGTIGVVLGAPFVHAILMGSVNRTALLLWCLLAMHFVLGVLYVRMRIRSTRVDVTFANEAARIRFASPTFIFAFSTIAIVIALYLLGVTSFIIPIAFLVSFPRLFIGYRSLGQKFVVKRLGWSEVAHSIVFAVILGSSGL